MSFAIDNTRQDENGAIHLYAGCDFLSLEPHQLIVRIEIEA